MFWLLQSLLILSVSLLLCFHGLNCLLERTFLLQKYNRANPDCLSWTINIENISSDSCLSAVIHDDLIDDVPYKSFQDTEVKRKILSRQSSTIRMDSDTRALISGIKIEVVFKVTLSNEVTSDHLSFVGFLSFLKF